MKRINYILENFIVSPAILVWFFLLAFVELIALPFRRENHGEDGL